MRGLQSTVVLLVALVALVGYIYFVDAKKPVDDAAAKDKAFTGITAEDVDEVEIKSAEGETSRLQKVDGKWQVVDP